MTILANTITADMGFIPGLGAISLLLGFPLSLIAAILERPFYTAAGIERHAVWYSIRANIVSLLVGYCCLILSIFCFVLGGLAVVCIWPVFAVSVSVFVEGRYLQKHAGPGQKLDRGWVIVANIFSAIACVMILLPVAFLESEANKRALRPYQLPLTAVMAVICLGAIVAAYVIPARAKRRAGRNADHSLIEVVSDGSAPPF